MGCRYGIDIFWFTSGRFGGGLVPMDGMVGARIHREIHAHAHMVAQTLSVLFREVIVSLSCTGGPVDVEDAWREHVRGVCLVTSAA